MSQRYSDATLLDAARSCVAEHGIGRTTVSDVARRAGASRMTVYRVFPDAATLWSTLLTREVGMIVAAAEDAAAGAANARGRLVGATLHAVCALRDDAVIRRVIELDGDRLLPYLTVRRGQAQEIALAAIAAHLEAGAADGSIRPLDAAAAARLLEMLIRSVVTAAPGLVDDGLTPRIDQQLHDLLDAYLRPAAATPL